MVFWDRKTIGWLRWNTRYTYLSKILRFDGAGAFGRARNYWLPPSRKLNYTEWSLNESGLLLSSQGLSFVSVHYTASCDGMLYQMDWTDKQTKTKTKKTKKTEENSKFITPD